MTSYRNTLGDTKVNLLHCEIHPDMSKGRSPYVHLVAGGIGGTVGATLTCPLEVVKTRLQSSVPAFRHVLYPSATGPGGVWSIPVEISYSRPVGVLSCLKHITQTEGVAALFKGLGPTLVGVAPSRALYFTVYAKAKHVLNRSGFVSPESKVVHIGSACSAGIVTSSLTSPLWVIKTRLQLDNRASKGQVLKLIQNIWKTDGIKGFYRGLTATYIGVTETVIHFVIYEHIKAEVQRHRFKLRGTHEKNVVDFLQFMMAAATSKCIASVMAYPHEVIRTRLRQKEVDGKRRYHSFFQAFRKILLEEGRTGLYGGLGTHLLRQVPNTALMFLTYEAVVNFFSKDDLS